MSGSAWPQLPEQPVSEETKRNWEMLEAQRAAQPRVRHVHEIADDTARAEAEHEAAAEAERLARDPRRELQQAHQDRTKAEAEVERLTAGAERAHGRVRELEARLAETEAGLAAGDDAAAARLAEALLGGGGRDALPLTLKTGQLASAASDITAKLAVARAAAEHLEGELAQAREQLAAVELTIKRQSLAAMIDVAADRAAEVIAAAAALFDLRSELSGLVDIIHAEHRELHRDPVGSPWRPMPPAPLPAQVRRALHPAPVGEFKTAKTDWTGRLAQLRAGAEAPE